MKINLFVTCIGDIVQVKMAKKAVVLLEKLGCEVSFPEQQSCCGQPSLNSGYEKDAIPAIKKFVETFEKNEDPIVCLAGSCTYSITKYPELFVNDPVWRERTEKVVARVHEITSFLVNILKVTNVGAKLEGTAVYHPSCSLFRKLGVVSEPIQLLEQVEGLKLLPIHNQETCCGFGGTFSVKMSEVSGEMVKEKVQNIVTVKPDFLIGADSGCLINIGGRVSREHQDIKVMHILEVLVSDQELQEY